MLRIRLFVRCTKKWVLWPCDLIKGAVSCAKFDNSTRSQKYRLRIVDTVGGGSVRIDLLKEKDYIRHVGCNSIETFVRSLSESSTFKKSLIETAPVVKVVDSNRISLWD